jgi:tetratricopeptide (TPR) repeat protein
VPEWVDVRDLDPSVRAALRGLESRNAEQVAQHLVAAGGLVDEDPEAALAHARAARDRASRLAAVREAVGVAAYHAGDYAEAARELRAYRRMSGDEGYRAVLADCERALGRPEVALRLVAEALADQPDADETVELRLVESGARRDLGEEAAATLVLESALGGRPRPEDLRPGDLGRLRLASAYADLLADRGEEERAQEWFAAIAAADPEDLTGALERSGIAFEDADEEDAEEDAAEDDDVPADGAGVLDDVETTAGRRADEDDVDEDDVDGGELDEDDVDEDDVERELAEGAGADDAPGYDFRADVESEVAELLGEDDGDTDEDTDDEVTDDATTDAATDAEGGDEPGAAH